MGRLDLKDLENERRDLLRRNERVSNTIGYLKARLDANDRAIITIEDDFRKQLEEYNDMTRRLQDALSLNKKELEKNEKRLTELTQKIKTQIACRFCNKIFHKGGILSHEKTCPMNPSYQEKEPEKAVKKLIDEIKIEEPSEIDKLRAEKERLEEIIRVRNEGSQELGVLKTEINNETEEIIWLRNNHPEWILQFAEDTEGNNAIWRGSITKGFREWLEQKGYVLSGD